MKVDLRTLAMSASLAAAVLMLVGKLGAFVLTGSTAILSDAAESIIHIGATTIAAVSLWYSGLPADQQHPYGHGKIAYFSAGLEGALICAASLAIIWAAVDALLAGPQLRHLGIGIAITGGLALVNLALGLFLIHVGRTRHTLVLVANGHHVLTDMWTSFGVVAGVTVVWMTGILWLDPAVAIVAGLNILVSAIWLMKKSFDGLMERVHPEQTRRIVACLDAAVTAGAISGYHQLRHRLVNDEIWVEVHLLLPGSISVADAHRIATGIEEKICDSFPGDRARITTHIEPVAHEVDHPAGHPV